MTYPVLILNRDHAGESILHLWIEKLRELLQVVNPTDEQTVLETVTSTEYKIPQKSQKFRVLDNEDSKQECPPVTSTDPFTERKSTFQGHVATVINTAQVKYDQAIYLKSHCFLVHYRIL